VDRLAAEDWIRAYVKPVGASEIEHRPWATVLRVPLAANARACALARRQGHCSGPCCSAGFGVGVAVSVIRQVFAVSLYRLATASETA
jgi:hypothetical protein